MLNSVHDPELDQLRREARELVTRGEWSDRAIEVNGQILQIGVDDVDAYTRLARCLREQNRLTDACAMYEEALRRDPRNVIAANALRSIRTDPRRASAPDPKVGPRAAERTPAWLVHWQNRYWRDEFNPEYEPILVAGSNMFSKRGVAPGHRAYIVTIRAGNLYLGGRLVVGRIVSHEEASHLSDRDDLYDAEEWIIASKGSGTPLYLHRYLSPDLTARLRCQSADGPKRLCFASPGRLDNQATRGIRELTTDSAALFDRVIEVTKRRRPTSNDVMVDVSDLA